MAIFDTLGRLLKDPLPDFAFELSEAGIAYARPIAGSQPEFRPLEEGALTVSPLADNVHKPDALADAVRAITGGAVGRRRRTAVLIVPDFCARVAVLGFDSLPPDPKDQLSLVRFRMKKSVPFDVESAVVGFYAQPARAGIAGVQVVVVAAALEIIARYEAPFRASGLHPGFVTTSALAMLDLVHEPDVSVVARLSRHQLTVSVINAGRLNLLRCVELASPSHEEILGVLFPTVAYVEDELQAKPARLLLCGFGDSAHDGSWQAELEVPVATLQSRLGAPNQFNAGLLGYLTSLTGAGAKVA